MLSLQGSDSTNDDNNFNLVTIGVPSVVGGVLLFAVVWWVCVVRVRRKRVKQRGEEEEKGKGEKGKRREVGEVGDMDEVNTVVTSSSQRMEAGGGGVQAGEGSDYRGYGGASAYAGSGHGGSRGAEGMGESLGRGSGVGYAGDDQRYHGQEYGQPGLAEREVIPIVMVRNDSGPGGSYGTYGEANGAGAGAAGGYWGDRRSLWPGGYV